MYDFTCEHCSGAVRERRVDREALRHKGSFVIPEDVPIGVCETCGARYFDASVLRRVAEIARGVTPSQRSVEIPVDRFLRRLGLTPAKLEERPQAGRRCLPVGSSRKQ